MSTLFTFVVCIGSLLIAAMFLPIFIFEEVGSKIRKAFTLIEILLIILSLIFGYSLVWFYPCSNVTDVHKSLERSISIEALSDSSQVNGKFYYHRGYINGTEYIQFIISNPDGSKEMRKVEAADSKFYEVEKDYRVEAYLVETERQFWFTKDVDKSSEYKFYVPSGTITNEFSIDLN